MSDVTFWRRANDDVIGDTRTLACLPNIDLLKPFGQLTFLDLLCQVFFGG